MVWSHLTIIIPAEHVAVARETCAAAHPAGHGMFTAALSFDGLEPITHYVSAGLVEDVWLAMMNDPALLYGAATQGAAAQGIEYARAAQEVATAFAATDVSQEPAHAAFARLGLAMVTDEVGAA